jgi:hypothetical protein
MNLISKHPENTAQMCACSNTLIQNVNIAGNFSKVAVNKFPDFVQGFEVRADSNSREK